MAICICVVLWFVRRLDVFRHHCRRSRCACRRCSRRHHAVSSSINLLLLLLLLVTDNNIASCATNVDTSVINVAASVREVGCEKNLTCDPPRIIDIGRYHRGTTHKQTRNHRYGDNRKMAAGFRVPHLAILRTAQ